MSLHILTEQQIKDNFLYLWPRLCLDPEFWEHPKLVNDNPFTRWHEVKFDRTNYHALNHLEKQEGIYMFIVKPRIPFTEHHSYIVYVGETSNLKGRFQKYFTYRNTSHPSDQKKRRMVIIWEDFLYFNYYLTDFKDQKKREDAEYDLIDSMAPPINDDFRSRVLNERKKALQF